MSRGPVKSGFNPSKEQYQCPVLNCNSIIRGDEISRHFTKNANLDLLCEALEYQANLRKNLPAGKVVANSDEFLKSLLAQVSNSEKVHTEYLFLLNKKYKCVLCEKFNKLFCYCKINR